MALYWPNKKVALDIVDDPARKPFEGDEDEWTVVRVTCAQLEDYDSCRRVMSHIARLLDSKAPQHPDWESKNQRFHQAFVARIA